MRVREEREGWEAYERRPLTGLFSCFRARNFPRPAPHFLNTRNRLKVARLYVSENFYDNRAFGDSVKE